MSGALDTPTRTRLARVLSMLSSNFDGEVLTAARMANKIVGDAGLDWETIINAVPSVAESIRQSAQWSRQTPPPPPPGGAKVWPAPPWEDQAEAVIKSGFALEWQVNFCTDLLEKWRERELSEKQIEALEGAWRKCRRMGADFKQRGTQ